MKKALSACLAVAMIFSLCACGSTTESNNTSASTSSETSVSEIPFVISEDPVVVSTEETKTEEVVEEEEVIPENSYRSELTNEWISNDLKTQRPVAVMVDNESVALPHYGTSEADIVYEMMNSTANDRITRLMCVFKDWQNVEVIGNIRSTRPTNAMLFAEYNAVLVHDGGPFMIDEWLAHPNSTNHLSGGFARIDRDKAGFYEEYATNENYTGVGEYAGKSYKSLLERIKSAGYDLEYNEYYMGNHFKFSDKVISLDNEKDVAKAETINLPYAHNKSKLKYNAETKTYIYSEYGAEYVDALFDDGRGLSFTNVIIQGAPFFEYGEGYMCYNAIGTTQYGFYCTGGLCIPIWWEKPDQDSLTKYYKIGTNEEITLNTGKTYITLCPLDVWSQLVIK